jgi:hypothetical protein
MRHDWQARHLTGAWPPLSYDRERKYTPAIWTMFSGILPGIFKREDRRLYRDAAATRGILTFIHLAAFTPCTILPAALLILMPLI